MKIIHIILILSTFFIVSCASTKTETITNNDEEKQEIKTENPMDSEKNSSNNPLIDEEYLRSTNSLTESEFVSMEEFTDDKSKILQIINELSEIMATKNYNSWLNYIEKESIQYYSNPVNLRKAQKKLPIKNLQLNDLEDYFRFIFIPSRKVSNVDEIRYISKTNIKAVQVKEDFSTVVYYYFVKKDGKWKVHLPTLD